jgi:hypothetical protein
VSPRIEPADKMTKVEIDRLVRCAKDCVHNNAERLRQLQVRQQTVGFNTHDGEAMLHLDNDNFILNSAAEKLAALDLSIPTLK